MKEHINKWPWGTTITYVAEAGAGLVTMSFENDNPGVCFISGLSVLPEVRRIGIGTALMNRCIDYCRNNRIFRIDLKSGMEDWLIVFYKNLGFREIQESEGFMEMYKLLY